MKTIKFGDILSVERGIIVHGCNAQGVMGSGIAAQIKNQYPKAYEVYRNFCMKNFNTQILGQVVLYQQEDLFIANAITQDNFGRDSKKYVNYQAVHTAFERVALLAANNNLDVHYPLIGAGLGGGDWAIISDIINTVMSVHLEVNHTLWIYE